MTMTDTSTEAVNALLGGANHADNITWPDWLQDLMGTTRALLSERDAEAMRADGAEMALWRIAPNTHTLSDEPADPFEGPGETYRDAYERVGAERDAAIARAEAAEAREKALREALEAFVANNDASLWAQIGITEATITKARGALEATS